jgi:hypothetical protein
VPANRRPQQNRIPQLANFAYDEARIDDIGMVGQIFRGSDTELPCVTQPATRGRYARLFQEWQHGPHIDRRRLTHSGAESFQDTQETWARDSDRQRRRGGRRSRQGGVAGSGAHGCGHAQVNGFQATRQITKNPSTSHIPVIIVTTKDQETDRIWGARQGAKSYVTKPVEEELLMNAINQYLPKP